MSKKQGSKTANHSTCAHCACLELFNPEARQVYVAGAFNDWHPMVTPMVALNAGRWVKRLALQPGRYEYRLVVDGQWADDPRAKEFVPNPHGGHNAVLIVEATHATDEIRRTKTLITGSPARR